MARTHPSLPDFDLYRELELDRRASTATIDAAWRSLVKRSHPDVHQGQSGADERTRRLNVAHEWLSDPALRSQYDAATRGRTRKAPAEGKRPSPPAPAPRATNWLPEQHQVARSALPLRVLGFYALCLASIVAAYVGTLIVAVIVSFANITRIAAALLGEEAALSIIQLLSNILFAVLAGYLMSESFRSAIRPGVSDIALVALGTAAILAMTFGFPAFASSYLPDLASWMGADGAGLPAVLVLSLLEAVVGGSAIAALGLAQPASDRAQW